MRQICNMSYVAQAEAFTDEAEFERWDDALPVPPGEKPRRRTRASAAKTPSSPLPFGGVART